MAKSTDAYAARSRVRVSEVFKRQFGREYRVRDGWFETILDGNEWLAAFHIVIEAGLPVVAELRIYPFEEHEPNQWNFAGQWSGTENAEDATIPHGGLTSTTVKKIRFGALQAIPELVALARKHPTYHRDLESFGLLSQVPNRHPGPKGKSDLYLAKLAQQYVNLVDSGNPNPVKTIAKKGRGRTPEQIRDLLHTARKRQLLSEAPKGQAGGFLLPLAVKLLDDD